MGIENYMIADATVGVIAQRLVRRLCPSCKRVHVLDESEKELLGVNDEGEVRIYEPVGCHLCDESGYKGRIGVYEIMEMTPALKLIISNNGSADDIKQQALKEGMNTLTMSAARFVLQGITSMSEMIRISFDS